MIEIKDIKLSENVSKNHIYLGDLLANFFDDDKFFCAESHDGQYCCVGIIVEYPNFLDKANPLLQINDIFKNTNSD